MDGDTLLTDDRSFLYSEKDIALICGSLVTIRKGTLQVIHLTIKEFLTSGREQSDPASASLLVNPEHASMQLALVCLRCIAKFAEPLADLKSMAPQIEWALDHSALERCRVRGPLLEYASFSWLSHIIDCKLEDILKITPAFQNTFNSSSSFSWVETCMVSQPDSTLRLLVGIDEIRDRLDGSREDLQYHQEPSCQFLASWCAAMSKIFQEYGAILARRPWEIYLIDFCDIFSANPSLQMLWQDFGETPLRSRDLLLNEHRASRPPQEEPQAHLQLQNELRSSSRDQTLIFLVHDERRHIYIWGEAMFGECHSLFIQHDETGQRLPPVDGFSEESGQNWVLIDHQLSPSGKHLTLFYNELPIPERHFDRRGLTIIWRFDDTISFKRRMNCDPWARVIFRHTSKNSPCDFQSKVILFQDDHHCITPSGFLNLLEGSRRSLPDSISEWNHLMAVFFTSCDGQYFLTSQTQELLDNSGGQATRVNLLEPSHSVSLSWKSQRKRLVDVSPTGRYLVLRASYMLFKPEENVLYLYDTHSDKTIELSFPKSLSYVYSKYCFSRNETRLVAFLIDQFLTVIIWDHITDTPRLTSDAALWLGLPIWRSQIYVPMTAASAVVVTNSRSITRIELGDCVKFHNASKFMDDYPYSLSAISRDCSHLAWVIHGQIDGKMQIIDLTSPAAPARHLDLEWSQSDIPEVLAQGKNVPMAFSPDLRILVINAEVFDLTTPTRGQNLSTRPTLTPFTIEALPPLLTPHRHNIKTWGLQCRISSCNSYVVYVGQGDQWGQTHRYSSAILLYHIDLQNKTSTRLDLGLAERLISPCATFHPSLPLMAIIYGSPTATEIEPFQKHPPPLRLAVCDLKSLAMTNFEVPTGRSTEALAE